MEMMIEDINKESEIAIDLESQSAFSR